MPLAAVPDPGQGPPGAEDSLRALLVAAATGDETSFAHLYDATSSRVYGMVLRVLRDPAQAAEVTQDVYVQLWQQAARFDHSRSGVLPWLLMIAHRRAVDRVRSAQASTERDTRYADRNADRDFDQVSDSVAERLEAERVRAALHALTEVQREAISLAFFDGLTHTEVAERLGAPVGTVKTRIRDGMIRMRDALGVNP